MTLEEAQTIGTLASTVDDGCSHCILDLIGLLNKAFPAFRWTYDGSDGLEDDTTTLKHDLAHRAKRGAAGGVFCREAK